MDVQMTELAEDIASLARGSSPQEIHGMIESHLHMGVDEMSEQIAMHLGISSIAVREKIEMHQPTNV